MQGKAPLGRGTEKQKHKNTLTGLIFDEFNNPYTPVFTNKKNKKYRYYCNQVLAADKSHPNHLRARFPSHEIESYIGGAVRDEVEKLSAETEGPILDHLLKHHQAIPTYNFVRSCVKRVIVYFDHVVIRLDPTKFKKLVEEYLNVSVTGSDEKFEVTKPFQTLRGRDTSIIIQSGEKDILDISAEDTKKLVQGIVWRDEHFDGVHINEIAKRENCSSRYIRNRIMGSFEYFN